MLCALKSSVVLGFAAMLLASSSAALAGEKCRKNSVTTVAYKQEGRRQRWISSTRR